MANFTTENNTYCFRIGPAFLDSSQFNAWLYCKKNPLFIDRTTMIIKGDDKRNNYHLNGIIEYQEPNLNESGVYCAGDPHSQSNTRNLDCISLFSATILVHYTVHSLIHSA